MDKINNKDYRNAVKKYNTKYNSILSKDEIELLVSESIWISDRKFDSNKSCFTTYLIRKSKFLFIDYVKKFYFKNDYVYRKSEIYHNNDRYCDIMIDLDTIEKDLIIGYYISKYSFRELAKKYHLPVSSICRKIERIKNKIKLKM